MNPHKSAAEELKPVWRGGGIDFISRHICFDQSCWGRRDMCAWLSCKKFTSSSFVQSRILVCHRFDILQTNQETRRNSAPFQLLVPPPPSSAITQSDGWTPVNLSLTSLTRRLSTPDINQTHKDRCPAQYGRSVAVIRPCVYRYTTFACKMATDVAVGVRERQRRSGVSGSWPGEN